MIPSMLLYVPRTACLAIGYLFGCFLTGAITVRLKTGRSASEFGTGNPGMANITEIFGLKMGLIVLAGDLIKTILACSLCLYLFGSDLLKDPYLCIGRISCLWGGLGAVIGHNWPFWRKFSGGKGVAVTCMTIVLFSPLWGILANAAGMMVVLTTGYLPLGAVVITMVYPVFCFLFVSVESGILSLALMVIMFARHWKGLIRMIRKEEDRYAMYLNPGWRREQAEKRRQASSESDESEMM